MGFRTRLDSELGVLGQSCAWSDVTCSPTALHPLPVSKPGCFDVGSGPAGNFRSTQARRRELLLDRTLRIVAMS